MKRIYYSLLLVLLAPTLYAQKINIYKTEVVGEKVFIYYDLSGSQTGQVYDVAIFHSLDNFTYPLISVTGDPPYTSPLTPEANG